jgi:hypothetical protein
MEDEKKFYLSRTFWGGVLVILASAAGLFGLQPEQLPSADEIVAIIGGVITIIGRFSARASLRL